jgi:hypothetical protein
MKFSENGLYVERYTKCSTCGSLIYHKGKQELLTCDGAIYCSQWCIDWKKAREARLLRQNAVDGSNQAY